MATKDFTITGGKEIMDVLAKFPVEMESKIMRGMVSASGREIAKEAKRLAPIETGDLRRSIRVSSRSPKNGKVTASVKAGGRRKGVSVYYAHMVEFGTKSHVIKPNKKRGKKAISFDGGVFADANHPGVTPRPFMRTAMDTQVQNALDASIKYARKRIAKEVKALASRANSK